MKEEWGDAGNNLQLWWWCGGGGKPGTRERHNGFEPGLAGGAEEGAGAIAVGKAFLTGEGGGAGVALETICRKACVCVEGVMPVIS